MTNELKIFEHPDFGRVRTVVIDDEPWFVGKDVAGVLGYANPTKAIRDHVDDDDKRMGVQNVTPSIIDSIGREQWPTFINESGLYALILSSKLPSLRPCDDLIESARYIVQLSQQRKARCKR